MNSVDAIYAVSAICCRTIANTNQQEGHAHKENTLQPLGMIYGMLERYAASTKGCRDQGRVVSAQRSPTKATVFISK